eukprot:5675570-Alexandrium_andersonii.AAC.1
MSATLVGSEMCIRDRSRPRPGPRRLSWVASKCQASQGSGQGALPGSVSYTHLTLPTICSV